MIPQSNPYHICSYSLHVLALEGVIKTPNGS